MVIGTGTAASTVAFACGLARWQVAVVDVRPYGGTCALRGCDPKKVLAGASETVDLCRRMQDRGVVADKMRIAWSDLMRFKRSFADPVPRPEKRSSGKPGSAHFTVALISWTAPALGSPEVLRAEHILIATGAEPANLGIGGEDLLTTSDAFLELDQLPPRVAFIGGGYISFEFAHIAAHAGSKATILHRGKSPLHRFDPDLVNRLVQYSRKLGIDVRLEARVDAIAKVASGPQYRLFH